MRQHWTHTPSGPRDKFAGSCGTSHGPPESRGCTSAENLDRGAFVSLCHSETPQPPSRRASALWLRELPQCTIVHVTPNVAPSKLQISLTRNADREIAFQ